MCQVYLAHPTLYCSTTDCSSFPFDYQLLIEYLDTVLEEHRPSLCQALMDHFLDRVAHLV